MTASGPERVATKCRTELRPRVAAVGEMSTAEVAAVTLKLSEFDTPSTIPVSGLQQCSTDTRAVRGTVIKPAGTTAVSWSLFTNVVLNGVMEPFEVQTALLRIIPAPSKFDPETVRIRSALPVAALEGESEEIEATDEGLLTVKPIEFDFERVSPIGSPVSKSTWAMTGLVSNAAGTTAVSRVLLT